MTKTKTKTKRLLLIFTISLAIIWYLTSERNITYEEPFQEVASEDSSHTPKITTENSAVEMELNQLPSSHLQCKEFTNGYSKMIRKWEIAMQNSASDWIEKGFSQDEIAYAIEHFRNSNFAQDWLVEQLVKESRVAKENKALTSQLMELIGADSSLPFKIQIKKEHPIKNLIGYQNMSAEERIDAIKIEAPTVNDIVAFIKSKKLTEQQVLELLSYVEKPTEIIVSTNKRAPIYLLEFVIAAGMHDVADALFDAGAEPMSNEYLTNALEIALRALSQDMSISKNISGHVSLIKKLAELNLTARHQILNNGNIETWTRLTHYSFDSETVLRLEEEYGLDLMSLGRPIEYKHQLLNSELISHLENQKHNFLSEEYRQYPYEIAVQNCDALQEKISEVWQPPHFSSMASFHNSNDKDTFDAAIMKADLAIRDPDHVDCFQGALSNRQRYVEENRELGKAYYSRPRHSPEWLTNFIQSRTFSDEELTWLFYASLSSNKTEDIIALTELGVFPTYLDYEKFNWRILQQSEITYLNANSLDAKSIDRNGKTMLYYAVKSRRIELIEYMLKQHYPFTGSEESQDPLHLALASWKIGYSESALLETLPLIMQFNPEIDDFHLARMQLIALRDNKLYLKIISQFPELVPSDETPYPDAGCI